MHRPGLSPGWEREFPSIEPNPTGRAFCVSEARLFGYSEAWRGRWRAAVPKGIGGVRVAPGATICAVVENVAAEVN